MVVHQTCVMEGIQPQHCLQAWGEKKNSFPILPRDKLNKWMIPNIIQSDPNWCIWH